jgi:uncharacterized protein (DUF305 family)
MISANRHDNQKTTMGHGSGNSAYFWLAVNIVASGAIMYLVMFSMIDGWGDFFNNTNMVYMTLAMLAPMITLMVLTMPGMYPNRYGNIVLIVFGIVAAVFAFLAIRQQIAIGDVQFSRSMIPHHSGAILMCRKASLTDHELITLCENIVKSQRDEIAQMNRILARLR